MSASNTIFVSLYLAILAFFILLCTFSLPSTVKTEHVIKSLHDTFVVDSTIEQKTSEETSSMITEDKDHSFAKIYKIIELISEDIEYKGDIMQITLHTHMIFPNDSPLIKKRMKKYINALASQIAGEKNITIDLTIDTKVDNNTMNIKRVSELTKTFINNGVSKKNMTIGIKYNHGSAIRLNLNKKTI